MADVFALRDRVREAEAELRDVIAERDTALARAERAEKQVQAVREGVAQAIEALPIHNGGYAVTSDYTSGHQRAQNHAARIAREHAPADTEATP